MPSQTVQQCGTSICIPGTLRRKAWYSEKKAFFKGQNIPHPIPMSYVKCVEATGKNTIMCLARFSKSDIYMKHVAIQ